MSPTVGVVPQQPGGRDNSPQHEKINGRYRSVAASGFSVILYQDAPVPPFYSVVVKAVESLKQEKPGGEQMLAIR